MFTIKYLITESSCTGCGVCSLLCQAKAITMEENRLGEVVPKIDKSMCSNCGLCIKVCPQNNQPKFTYPQKCFVVWSKNQNDWIYSASGGLGVSFLRHVVHNGEVAYGCDYDKKLDLEHFKINDDTDLIRSRSSKYSQSTSYSVFKDIKRYLLQDKQVVFIGTPCQISGLKRYLNREYSKLITIDLICHGTPPNRYLKEHIVTISNGKCVDKVRFRGEYDQKLSLWYNEKILYQKDRYDDPYFNLFYKNIISRESCYSCQYARGDRVSDITIGDFWGLQALSKIERKSNRPSIALINTSKGQQFFDSVKDELFYEERPVEEGIRGNGRLNNPPGKNYYTYIFRFLYVVFGFEKTAKITLFVKRWLSKFLR